MLVLAMAFCLILGSGNSDSGVHPAFQVTKPQPGHDPCPSTLFLLAQCNHSSAAREVAGVGLGVKMEGGGPAMPTPGALAICEINLCLRKTEKKKIEKIGKYFFGKA